MGRSAPKPASGAGARIDDDAQEPQRHTGHLIRRAQQVHAAIWLEEVSAEVTSSQYGALTILERMPGASQRELGAELGFDRSTTAELVARLESAGLIAREQDTVDRRRNILRLAPAGADLVATLRPRVARADARLVGGLGDAERDALRALLRRVIDPAPRH